MDTIFLPALTGKFGVWRYYQVLMTVEQLTQFENFQDKRNYRIKTAAEVDVIYSDKISEMLQRVFDESRLEPLKNYLFNQKEKYINNLTVAFFDGSPEWIPIGIMKSSLYDIEENLGEEHWEDFSKKYGIIKLSGKETLFVLDGQHRIRGLRETIDNGANISEEQISVTFISHAPSIRGKKKTRRLFTTINRYAKPISLGEAILLDEDDLSAIITRKLIEDYKLFSKNNVIAFNKNANLSFPKDFDKLSTVICLWNINELFINPKEVYPEFKGPKRDIVRIRPEEEVIEVYRKMIFKYWDDFFNYFQIAKNFCENNHVDYRNDNGNYFFLRPIGQEVIFKLIKSIEDENKNELKSKISSIEKELDSEFWKYVLFNPHTKRMINNKSYATNYLKYHFRLNLKPSELIRLKENYKKNSGDLELELPNPNTLFM